MALYSLPCGGHVTVSDDRRQVYRIKRRVGSTPTQAAFVLLHPSTTKRQETDPEVQLCADFAERRGFGTASILYLFPYRAENINEIVRLKEIGEIACPWGSSPLNKNITDQEIFDAKLVIAAWGDDGCFMDRADIFRRRYDGTPRPFSLARETVYPVHALGLTSQGQPSRITADNIRHEPLLLPALPYLAAPAA